MLKIKIPGFLENLILGKRGIFYENVIYNP